MEEQLRKQMESLQRNYDTMSKMFRFAQQELQQVKLELDVERGQSGALRDQLESALRRADAAEQRAGEATALQLKVQELEAECAKMKQSADAAAAAAATARGALSSQKQLLMEAALQSGKLQRQVESLQASERKAAEEAQAAKSVAEASAAAAQAALSQLADAKSAALAAQQQRQVAEKLLAEAQLRGGELQTRCADLQVQLEAAQQAGRQAKSSAADAASAQRTAELTLAAAQGQIRACESRIGSLALSLELKSAELGCSEGRVSKLEEELSSSRAAARCEAERLNAALAASQQQCQQLLGKGAEAGACTAQLAAQLSEAGSQLAAAQRGLKESQERCGRLEAELRGSQQAVGRAQDQLATERHHHEAHLQGMAGQIEALEQRVAKGLAPAAMARVESLEEDCAKLLPLLGAAAAEWERKCGEVQACALQLGSLAGTATQASVSGVQAGARARLQEVEAAAAAAEAALRQQLAAVRADAEAAVAAERERLGSRLAAVEQEMQALMSKHGAEVASAAQLAALQAERAAGRERQLQERVSGLEAQIKEQADALAEQAAQLRLSASGQAETDKARAAQEEKLAALQRQRQAEAHRSSQAALNLSSALETGQKLLQELQGAAASVAAAELAVKRDDAGTRALLSVHADPGDCSVLCKLMVHARLMLSYLSEALQEAARQLVQARCAAAAAEAAARKKDTGPPSAAAPVVQNYPPVDWERQAQHLQGTVAKLLHAEQSLASSYTCLQCLEIFTQPMLCVPCGHTFCAACLAKAGGRCGECQQPAGGGAAVAAVHNSALDALASKYEYKLSALQDMSKMLQRAAAQQAAA